MNIGSVKILKFNVVLEKNKEKLERILETEASSFDVVNEEGIFGGEIEGTVYEFDQDLENLNSVQIVKQDQGHLVDIVFLAELDQQKKRKIEHKDEFGDRKEIFDGIKEEIQIFTSKLPTLEKDGKERLIFYLEDEDERDYVSEEQAEDILKDNEDLLKNYGYVQGRDVSLYKNTQLLWYHSPIFYWRRITVVQLREEINPPKSLPVPAFSQGIMVLRHLYRAFTWSNYYMRHIEEQAESAYGYEKSVNEDFEIFLKRHKDLLCDRKDWIDLSTRSTQERSELERILNKIVRIRENESRTLEREQAISTLNVPKPGVMVNIYDDIDHRFDKLESLQEKTERNFEAVSNFVQEATALKDSEANYNLQSEIRILEYVVGGLAALQVFIALSQYFNPLHMVLGATAIFLTTLLILNLRSLVDLR